MSFDPTAKQSSEYFSGEGPVHRITQAIKVGSLTEAVVPNVWELLRDSIAKNASRPCFGRREVLPDGSAGEFIFQTYAQVGARVQQLASGLTELGITPKSHVGIYAKNRPEWGEAYIACQAKNLVVIPLYDTLGPDASAYVINHAELTTIVSSGENVPKLLQYKPDCPTLERVIVCDPILPEVAAQAKSVGVTLLSYDDVLATGKANPSSAVPKSERSSEDLFAMLFTSGTSGVPKGVMLSHSNICATLQASDALFEICPDDVYLSYLPAAHVMELFALTQSICKGAQIGFWRGDVLLLVEDIAALRPTILFGAPRVWNKIYDKIQAGISEASVVKRTLFNYAFSTKLQQLHETGEVTHRFWDALVFSKIAAVLGGRLRLAVSGSAPLSATVQDFLRVVFMTPVIQGYGLTESCATLTAQQVGDWTSGHVGPPTTNVEVKLVDIPDMNYFSSGAVQQGEICARGPSIFKGYYKMPDKTAEDIDRDGWFHTGDVGQWMPNGTLKIIDRKKNIFKLAQGEYVAAEYIETVLLKCKYVGQIFVYGDSYKNYLVAVIVPDLDILATWAAKNGLANDPVALCQNPKFIVTVFRSLTRTAVEANLKGFEKVKNVHLEPEPWTPQNGILTPTMKLKRPFVKTHYAATLETLYKQPRMDAAKL